MGGPGVATASKAAIEIDCYKSANAARNLIGYGLINDFGLPFSMFEFSISKFKRSPVELELLVSTVEFSFSTIEFLFSKIEISFSKYTYKFPFSKIEFSKIELSFSKIEFLF